MAVTSLAKPIPLHKLHAETWEGKPATAGCHHDSLPLVIQSVCKVRAKRRIPGKKSPPGHNLLPGPGVIR
jgi:hypothetical protein